MASNLEKLESIARDAHLSPLVENIIIHDDIEKLDPWNIRYIRTADFPHNIWPRDETGRVICAEIGVESLTRMLRTRQLRPRTIKIRDYQANEHLPGPADPEHVEPEPIYMRELIAARAPSGTDPASVALMARDLVRDANVSITLLSIGQTDWPIGEERDLYMHFGVTPYTISVRSPVVVEVTMTLSTDYEGQETDFSLLHTADLSLTHQDAMSYWFEQVFYKALALKTFERRDSRHAPPCTTSLTAGMVVPKLTKFGLARLPSTSADQITAMLASSRESLTRLSLVGVTLDEESSWEELLASIAKDFRALISFRLSALTGDIGGDGPCSRIDFHKAVGHIPREFEAGVFLSRRPPAEERVTAVTYKGPNAAELLRILSGYVDMLTPADIEERRARAIPLPP